MENRLNIGELDTLVTVRRATQSIGSEGQKKFDFVDHSKVWAKIERMISETIDNGNLAEGNTLSATIYKIGELTTRWRVVVGGISYEITAIDPVSRFSPLCILTLRAID